MEEKKEGKEIKISPNVKKYSYEDLEGICAELSQENQQMKNYIQNLHKQIAALDATVQYRRLDYLFKIVETANAQSTWNFSAEFVGECIAEIEEALTIPEEKPQSKEAPKEN